jgi:hypothetical protein
MCSIHMAGERRFGLAVGYVTFSRREFKDASSASAPAHNNNNIHNMARYVPFTDGFNHIMCWFMSRSQAEDHRTRVGRAPTMT